MEILQVMTSLFQLTASRGGRPNQYWKENPNHHFNSRPHEEADLLRLLSGFSINRFQLTASRGGRHWVMCYVQPKTLFQLTASRGGRQDGLHMVVFDMAFQLTASRGGRPKVDFTV